jgi:Holliday junction resolvase-like predicted endonuclease
MSMKFLSAYQLLESQGFKIEKKVNESTGEIEVVASVYIKHDTVKHADMRTKEGRRVYHMNARSFGIHESKDERIQEAIKVAKEHGYRILNEDRIGGSTVGMFHKKGQEVDHAWTWIDIEGIKEALKGTGITVTEQHGQANVTKDWDEVPVPGTPGVDGPYGEGSSSIMMFIITTERSWMIKFTGTQEAFEAAKVYPEDEEFEALDDIIRDNIPAYAEAGKPMHDDEYKVDISFKAR